MSRPIAFGACALLLVGCRPADTPSAPNIQAAPAASPVKNAAWQALQARYLHINVKPTDPVEALEWIEVRCDFLGSEIGGDNSAQDRVIHARMNDLGCGDPMIASARTLRTERAADPAVVTRLDALLARQS